MTTDPYRTLGVDRGAGEAELRAAYRRLVQRHHPDHNGGSVQSARRFEEIQEAWADIRRRRSGAQGGAGEGRGAATAAESRPAGDPDIEARLRTMEAELQQARSDREAAAAAAHRAAAQAAQEAASSTDAAQDSVRPSDEELGYIRSDDSFTKILADVGEGLRGSLDQKPARERAADVLEEVAARLRGGSPPGGRQQP